MGIRDSIMKGAAVMGDLAEKAVAHTQQAANSVAEAASTAAEDLVTKKHVYDMIRDATTVIAWIDGKPVVLKHDGPDTDAETVFKRLGYTVRQHSPLAGAKGHYI